MADEELSIYLYPSSVVLAIFVIVYTVGSAIASGICHLLYRLNHKEVVYVSLLSISVTTQLLFTIAQAVIEIADYPQILQRTYNINLTQWRNPDASPAYTTSPNLGIQIVFGIRMYFFNVEGLLFFFWSLMLFISVWEIDSKLFQSNRFVLASKWISFILPAVQAIFQYLPIVAAVPLLQIALANIIIVWSLTSGCVFLFLILIRCFQVMRDVSSYNISRWSGYDHGKISTTRNSLNPSISSAAHVEEDRYILVRFVLDFLVISGLQCSFLLSQFVYASAVYSRSAPDAAKPKLGWTHDEQLEDQAFFLAGSSTGYLVLLIFGTTRESRQQLKGILRTGQIRSSPPSPSHTLCKELEMRPAGILRSRSPTPLPLRGQHMRKSTLDGSTIASSRAISFMLSPGRPNTGGYRRMDKLEEHSKWDGDFTAL